MNRLRADYHTHTIFSDGKGTVMDNARAAQEKGIKTLGISDHSWGHGYFGLKKNKKEQYFKEIEEAKKAYPDLRILKSIEANILGADGAIDLSPEEMKEFDLVLCGYHFGSKVRGLSDLWMHASNAIYKYLGLGKKYVTKRNTKALLAALDHSIHVLTHPGDKGPVDIVPIAKKAAEKGIMLEVNERHHHLTQEQLQQIKDVDLKFLLSSDAHTPDAIGEVEGGYERLVKAGIDRKRIVNLRGEHDH